MNPRVLGGARGKMLRTVGSKKVQLSVNFLRWPWGSIRLSLFESGLLCFWIRPSVFWLSPSHFFESDLLYFDSVLSIYWNSHSLFWVGPSLFDLVLPIYWIGPFLFLSSSFSVLTRSFSFIFLFGPSYFESVLPIFSTASSLLLLVLRFDLINMCTVDKISTRCVQEEFNTAP